MSQVVVVGAGVGGLAAAARLAAAGHEVVVCERGERVGGKLGVLEREGYRFDTGPSLLTLPQVFEELFGATGAPLAEVLDLATVEPIARYRFADGSGVETSAERDTLRQNMTAAFGPQAAREWDAVLDRAARMWAAVEEPVLRSPVGGLRGLARLGRRWRDVPLIAPHRTLRGLGRQVLSDPRQRLMLERYATYSGSDPRRAPAALATIAWAEAAFGGWYVQGGLHRLAEALADRIEALGGTVRTGTAVAAIEVVPRRAAPGPGSTALSTARYGRPAAPLPRVASSTPGGGAPRGGTRREPGCSPRRGQNGQPDAASGMGMGRQGRKVSGVRLVGGERLAADVVVANADAAQVFGALLPLGARVAGMRLPRGAGVTGLRLRRARRSLSGFVLLLGVRGRTPGVAHHTVLFPADYDAEFDAIFGPRPRPVPDPTIYVAVPPDPTAAPEGCEAWFVLVNAPGSDRVDWDRPGLADRYAQRILDLMAARGLDVRDRLAFVEVRTPADLARDTATPGGAIYGTASHGPIAAFLRPPNRTRIAGLYLAGGSSHPGGGLPLVALSGAIVADLIARDGLAAR